MKIVIAPDSYKETLTSIEVASAIESGFQEIFPNAEFIKLPIADGGEGTVDSMVTASNGRIFFTDVQGPMGEITSAKWGMLGNSKTAVIEIAEACGLHLVPKVNRNPMKASSFGVGELLLAAIEKGANHIIIGLGGSATNDGGYGFLRAIGVKFLNSKGKELNENFESLSSLSDINLSQIDAQIKNVTIDIACDVDNPLLGSQGASQIFAAQKGADSSMIRQLESTMTHYSRVISNKLNCDFLDQPGFGAAGGLGYGFSIFLDSKLKSGINIVLERFNFSQILEDADLVVTGEGRIDSQSERGKAPIGVISHAKKHDCRVFVIAGSVDDSKKFVQNFSVDGIYSIVCESLSIEQALSDPYEHLKETSKNAARDFKDLVT